MKENRALDDDLLELVDGGVVIENWQDRIAGKISFFKNQYGEEGKDRLLSLASGMLDVSLSDQTADQSKFAKEEDKLALADKKSILSFIDDNWDNI